MSICYSNFNKMLQSLVAICILAFSTFGGGCFGFRLVAHHYHHQHSQTHGSKFESLGNARQSQKDDRITLSARSELLFRGGDINNDKSQNDTVKETAVKEEIIIYPQYSLPNIEYETPIPCTKGLILMDSFCPYHGGYLSHQAKVAYNAGIVHTVSDYVLMCLLDGNEDDSMIHQYVNAKRPTSKQNSKFWLDAIPFEVVGIICESDSGLDDAELLGVDIGLYPKRHDGYNKARRDKYLTNQVVGDNGLRVVRQKLCSTLDEAIAFARDTLHLSTAASSASLDSTDDLTSTPGVIQQADKSIGLLGKGSNFPTGLNIDNNQSSISSPSSTYCVVKPCRGVASDDVQFCQTLDEIKNAFQQIHQTPVFGCASGTRHESVLIQEFAKGTEYAIDVVSKNGEHKIAALWRYDKRPCNGAPFVYYATEIINSTSPTGKIICEYVEKVLNVLSIKWGLSHVEVILNNTNDDGKDYGPILVEVNCRQHNTDFVPLTSISIGYNALDLLLAAYLGDNENLPEDTEHMRIKWDDVPSRSMPRAFAAIVHLVSSVEGEIISINTDALEEIESLPSVLAMEIYEHFSVGNQIQQTIDIRSDSGWVHLMNEDGEQFISDYERIVELMPQMFNVH